MAATWAANVVERLIDLRADGYDFDRAWRQAISAFPPRASDDGGWSPQLAINGEETVTGFFRRACEAAFYGQEGALGSGNGRPIHQWRREIVREVDDASPALRSTSSHGRFRQAA